MLDWFGTLAESLFAFGYLGMYIALILEGFGLPFPGDVVMALYGYAISEHHFHFLPAVVVCTLGYATGAVIAYLLSLKFGTRLVDRFTTLPVLNRRSMMRTTGMMDRYGPWLLVPGRFLPGVRSVSSYVAGLGRMDVRPFLLYTVIGASMWCAAWIGIGVWFGENVNAVISTIQSSLLYITILGCTVFACYFVWRRRRVR